MGAVAAAKKKKSKRKSGSDWSWRLAGIALCAFFALGVITGLSRSGRIFALRVEAMLNLLPRQGRSALIPQGFSPPGVSAAARPSRHPGAAGGAIALVERTDGFYALDGSGELRGPISPAAAGDLPILSGLGVSDARADRLVGYAEMLVRAEVNLSEPISEMRVGGNGAAILFPERSRLEVEVNLDDMPAELARADRVLRLWRGHREMLAAIDMTTPGQAVVRLKPAALEQARPAAGVRGVAMTTPERERRNPPEVTAVR